jgi:hypothetical protein
MRTLSDLGLLREEDSEPSSGSIKRYFSSAVGEEALVLDVLKETEESDNRLLAQSVAG